MKVRVERLTKRFGAKGVPAVHGATFEAADGGITTLLGPSGSGKTTILRIIAGLETSDDGRVFVGEEDIINIPARKRGFGFVFQNFGLAVNHLLRPIRQPDAEVEVVLPGSIQRVGQGLTHPRSVLGMNQIQESPAMVFQLTGSQAKHPEGFIGPMRGVGLDVPIPRTDVSDSLCRCQSLFALA